jgi:hypothetical protein
MARSLRTCLAVFLLGVSSGPGATEALLQQFAVCAGRLSAVMEDQWMFDGPASEHTRGELAAMVALVEALMPPESGVRVMDWRIKAKVAQRALLHQARFRTDARLSAVAMARAETLTAECRSLLLGQAGTLADVAALN